MNEVQISVESVDSLTRRLNVTVPVSQLEQSRNQRLVELAKKTRLDGFRPGKVPISVIEKLYGNSLWQEIIEKSLQTSLLAALEQKALNPTGQPHIESIKAEPGTDLTYTASFEIYPKIEAPELKGMSLERLNVVITEADLDKVLEQMRLQYAKWIEVPKKAHYGHQVTFDLVFSDSEEKTRRDLQWVLEESKIPEGFSVLLNSSAGETLQTSFPKEQGSDELHLAKLEVKKIAEVKLPDLDNTFAKRLDVKEGTIEALREQIKKHMQIELDRVLREKLKAQVIDKLITSYAIEELPPGLLTQEFQRLEQDVYKQYKSQEGQEGKEKASLSEIEKTDLMQMARRRVKLGLLFNVLIEKHHLQVDETRVQQHIDQLASAFQFDQMVRDRLYKDKNMMMGIRSSVLEEQVIDKLLEEVEYTVKVAQYSEIMNLTRESHIANTEGTTA
jgi:trigger factor